jgi:ATP adenylyltransferase
MMGSTGGPPVMGSTGGPPVKRPACDVNEMKNKLLWAPWRMGYINGEKEDGCLFCRKAEGLDDVADHVVARGERSFVLLNLFPYNSGHLMVAPYRHTGELEDLAPEEIADLMALVRKAVEVLKNCLRPEGFNVGFNLGKAAGAGIVDHIHLHIVPRWQGDTNFMPVISDTRVVPQALDDTGRLLRDAFAKL